MLTRTREWIFNMPERNSTFKQGADFYAKEMDAFVGGETSRITNGDYLASIQKEIENLSNAINNYNGNGSPQLKGYVAEAWHTYTFNIDAAAKQSVNRAIQKKSNKLGSVDITTTWGDDYSLKYYKSGADSAIAQGHPLEMAYQRYIKKLNEAASVPTRQEYLSMNGIDPKTDMSLGMYEGQARLIPSDQIKDAIEALNRRIAKELNNMDNPDRSRVAERLIQVKQKLTSHLESPDGALSSNLTENESKELASLAREGKFDPSRYDITLAQKADLFFLCNNALKAGVNAAWISAIIKMVPEIMGSLKKLLQSGYISSEDLKHIGQAGVSGAKDGFLMGFFTAAISTAAETGLLGDTMRIASLSKNFPPIIGAMVVILELSISDGIKFAKGELTGVEYAHNIEKNIFISVGGVIGGLAIQSLAAEIPMIPYAIGSMIGSLIGGLVFSFKEHVMISLCTVKGYTIFGLVEQDYTMPRAVREKLGFPVYGFDEYQFQEYQFQEYKPIQYQWQEYKWKSIECILLKRGVVACRKIGYI